MRAPARAHRSQSIFAKIFFGKTKIHQNNGGFLFYSLHFRNGNAHFLAIDFNFFFSILN